MSAELLYDQPEWPILVGLLGLLLLAIEAGYRVGRRRRPASSELVRAQVGSIQGALLGLFALLLGFTFAMALARFDVRRQMVVREANAIGTAALRAQLLPAGQRAHMAELFRRYVETRRRTAHGPNIRTPGHMALDAEAGRLQGRMRRQAAAAAEADPRSVPRGLLLQAMNELIDVKGERDAALANHVPESVLMLLFAFAVLTSGVLGYGNGLAGARALGTAGALTVVITLVILIIIDLDRPRRGLIHVSEESMINLQQSLGAPQR